MARTLRRVVGGAALAAALLAHGSHLGAQADGDLIAAIKNRDLEQVRVLLDQHADVNARGADGATALHWAAYWDKFSKTGVHANDNRPPASRKSAA